MKVRFTIYGKLSRRSGFKLACSAVSARFLHGQTNPVAAVPDLVKTIPPRPSEAPTGSQFAASVLHLDKPQREAAILGQILDGNLPGFLRKLAPVKLRYAPASGEALTATVFAMPEYLAIGSDSDFLRIPMNLFTAEAIAKQFRFLLPTRKMVDAVYDQAPCRFTPQPLPAGPEMTSTEYYRTHNALIDRQSQSHSHPFGVLAAGHKKDVVLTNLLNSNPGRIAIYGWHRAKGDPIQPLSLVHGATYADYSHGIRLVAGLALVEGKLRAVAEVLQDRALGKIFSDEGLIHVPAAFSAA